jgi:hypothetical protein
MKFNATAANKAQLKKLKSATHRQRRGRCFGGGYLFQQRYPRAADCEVRFSEEF